MQLLRNTHANLRYETDETFQILLFFILRLSHYFVRDATLKLPQINWYPPV